MKFNRTALLMICLLIMCLSFSGCTLLTLPFQIIGGIFSLLGKALQVADSLPKPPPGVFF